MQRLARYRARSSRVRFHFADIRDWTPNCRNYDLIVTHFFLDCFDRVQLPIVIEKIAAATVLNARWLISDFVCPSNGLRRIHATIYLRAMYSFFRCVANLETRKLIDPSPMVRALGFELREREDMRFGLVSSQFWQR